MIDNDKHIGRPGIYNDEFQHKADEYIFKYKELGNAVPSLAGLACYLGITRETVYDFRRKYTDFSDTCMNILTLQEMVTLDNGLLGKFNPTITKLVLANHGYSDKQDLNHTSEDGSMTPKAGIDTSKLSTEALAEIMALHDDQNS